MPFSPTKTFDSIFDFAKLLYEGKNKFEDIIAGSIGRGYWMYCWYFSICGDWFV